MATATITDTDGHMVNSVGQVIADGNSRIQVGNTIISNFYNGPPKENQCLVELRLTDPTDDKIRIEQTKGGLLRDSYKWILEHEAFQQWRTSSVNRLLWIKGDAGKGKTMLLCGIIDELSNPPPAPGSSSSDSKGRGGKFSGMAKKFTHRFKKPWASATQQPIISFFFCQGTDSRLNSAVAILRGLVYVLVRQVPEFISYIQDVYKNAGPRIFDDGNAFFTISQILINMLRDPRSKGCFMLVDALDECEAGLPQLLSFISQCTTKFEHVKWIVSSRNRHDIEQQLNFASSKETLSLELNGEIITEAIYTYIDHQVAHLISLEGDQELQDQVRDEMREKSDGTFLWVALVAQKLQTVQTWNVLSVIEQMPTGLVPLYRRMMADIQQLSAEDSDLCRLILSTAALAYRPLQLGEVGKLATLPESILKNVALIKRVAGLCGSFLTVRGDHVYLIHQSVKTFLLGEGSVAVFRDGLEATHLRMLRVSLAIMNRVLHRDMYGLKHPGTPQDYVRCPEVDPLATAKYSCSYWIEHLVSATELSTLTSLDELRDSGSVYQFLSRKYLYWLEALSLIKDVAQGITSMAKLDSLLNRSGETQLCKLVYDGRRFLLMFNVPIQEAPIQVYELGLLFAPKRSIIRKLFEKEQPKWVTMVMPDTEEDWDACLTTVEDQIGINDVVFSPDGEYIASAAYDPVVKIWNATTGTLASVFEGHTSPIQKVAFSPDGKLVASGTFDGCIMIWTRAGRCLHTLQAYGSFIQSISFSPDGTRLVAVAMEKHAKVWDTETGECIANLRQGILRVYNNATFLGSRQHIAMGEVSGDVQTWDLDSGQNMLLGSHKRRVTALAFCPVNNYLVSGCDEPMIRLWGLNTRECIAAFKGHELCISSLAFSPDGQTLTSSSSDDTFKIWELATKRCISTIGGNGRPVVKVCYSPDGKRLVAATNDERFRIWDLTVKPPVIPAEPQGHKGRIQRLTFSPDGKYLASVNMEGDIKIWDAVNGHLIKILDTQIQWITSLVFSRDCKRLATSTTFSTDVTIWNVESGQQCLTIVGEHSGGVHQVAFSPDDEFLISGGKDKKIIIWDAKTGVCLSIIHNAKGELEDFTLDEINWVIRTNSKRFSLKRRKNAKPSVDCVPPLTGPETMYSVWPDTSWLTYNYAWKLLWIPPTYRSAGTVSGKSMIATGCSSGRVCIFRLTDKLPFYAGR